MEVGQHQFDGGHAEFGMHVDGDSAAVVGDGHRAVDVDGDLDAVAIAGQVFVDRVIQNLEHTMVKPAHVRVADIHAGTLADGLQPLEFIDLGGIVLLLRGYLGFGFQRLVWRISHKADQSSWFSAE